jgi:tetratricopeptide (TPR) repeat protein
MLILEFSLIREGFLQLDTFNEDRVDGIPSARSTGRGRAQDSGVFDAHDLRTNPTSWRNVTACIATAFALLFIVYAQAAPPSDDRAELLRLAEQVKAAFRPRMEPPAGHLTVIDVALRDRLTFLREYVLESHGAAVEALLAEANDPDRTRQVAAALREVLEKGNATIAEAVFTGLAEREAEAGANREAAAAVRHSVALSELPAALARLIKRPGDALPFPPDGQKAWPAYVRAADLDPDHSWTWIVLAQGATNEQAFEFAVGNAERAARAADDLYAWVVAHRVAGLLHQSQSRFTEAAAVLEPALDTARRWTAAAPADPLAQRALAACLIDLGESYKDLQRYDDAEALLAEALDTRLRLAVADPDDDRRQLEVIAAQLHLWALKGAAEDMPAAAKFWDEAWRLYDVLASRQKFTPQIDPFQPSTVMLVLGPAGGLTLLLGLVLLARYRRVVARWMNAAATATGTEAAITAPVQVQPSAEREPLSMATVDTRRCERRVGRPSQFIGTVNRAARRAAWTYGAASLGLALVGAVLWLTLGGVDLTQGRVFLVTWTYGWPVVLTLGLLWGPDRRRLGLLLAGYFGALLAFSAYVAFGPTPPTEAYGITVPPFFQPLLLWAGHALPTAFLLLFLNRSIRAIGPVLLVFMIAVFLGAQSGIILQSSYGVMLWIARTMGGMEIPVSMQLAAIPAAGMLLMAPVGWWSIRWIRRRFEAKRLADQTLVFDSIWLF